MANSNDLRNVLLSKFNMVVDSNNSLTTPKYIIIDNGTDKTSLWYEDGRQNPRHIEFEFQNGDWHFNIQGTSNKQRGEHCLSKMSQQEIIDLFDSLKPNVYNDFTPNYLQ